MWHDDVILLFAFQLLTYTQMPIPGWEAKPCPNFPGIATFGLRIQWRWSRVLEMAGLAKKRILNFWVDPKKDLPLGISCQSPILFRLRVMRV